MVRGLPWRLSASYPPVTNPLSPEQRQAVRDKLRLKSNPSFGDVLHWLWVFGTGPEATVHDEQVRRLLDEITDAARLEKRYQVVSSLVRTAHGVRYTFSDPRFVDSRRERGRHAYQALAVFAELGVPTTQPLTTPQGIGTVADLLQDCLFDFQLREVSDVEPEWAATAIALYLPPARAWQNRWGEKLTFDDLGRYLLERPQAKSSCAGTHLLFDLAVLMQVHRQCPIFSRPVALQIDDFLAVTVATVERTQRPDGSWGTDWRGQTLPYSDSPATSLLITGHLAECLTYLSPNHQVRADIVFRSLGFLAKTVEAASEAEVANDYCPYSHAARVLLHCPNHKERV
jgi:hypothetical protein